METQTQSDMAPPKTPPKVALAMNDDLAERIANLTLAEAVRVSRYLREEYGY